MTAIYTQGLQRRFGKTTAVEALNLKIATGEIYGLIGPDGSGKTTTLRMLAAVLKPSAGKATIASVDIVQHPEHLRHLVGYMPQHFSLYGDLSVLENLVFFASIFGIRGRERSQRVDRLLHFAQLQPFIARPAGQLSGGMKKKLALACALIHQPQVLLLDEPTNGVDPISRREFWDILSELHLSGVTLLITTPYMDEAERCSQIGLMHRGRIIRQGHPKDLRQLVPGQMLAVFTPNLLKAESLITAFPDYLAHQLYGDRLHVFLSRIDISALKAFLINQGVQVEQIMPDEPRLEEAFVHLISDINHDRIY